MAKGELLGVVSIDSKRPASYYPQQLPVVERLSNQIAVALSNIGLIQQLQDLLLGVVNSLVTALDAKSPWTTGHSQRVSELAVELGHALRLSDDELYELRLAALFHHVGKLGTYDVVLDKTGTLTEQEFNLIKKHPRKAREILSPITKSRNVANVALHHHEKWDGTGYPDTLSGDDIPYLSRIVALADAFDTMSSDRPYRKGLEQREAAAEISKLAGKQFDRTWCRCSSTSFEKKRPKKTRSAKTRRRHELTQHAMETNL